MFSRSEIVRFADCDTAGAMYFPRFLEAVNDLTEAWFRDGLGVDFHTFHLVHNCGVPVVNTRVEALAPCRLGETLELSLALESIGRSSLVMDIRGTAGGAVRLRVRHKVVFISLEHYHAIAIPGELRGPIERYRVPGAEPSAEPQSIEPAVPAQAFRARQTVHTSHCDPAGIVFYPRVFEMLCSAQEEWFEHAIGWPYGGALRAAGLAVRTRVATVEFVRVSRLSDHLDIDLWLLDCGDAGFTAALATSCSGELRLKARLECEFVAPGGAAAPPVPAALLERMRRFLPG